MAHIRIKSQSDRSIFTKRTYTQSDCNDFFNEQKQNVCRFWYFTNQRDNNRKGLIPHNEDFVGNKELDFTSQSKFRNKPVRKIKQRFFIIWNWKHFVWTTESCIWLVCIFYLSVFCRDTKWRCVYRMTNTFHCIIKEITQKRHHRFIYHYFFLQLFSFRHLFHCKNRSNLHYFYFTH